MEKDVPFIPDGLIDVLERQSFGLPSESEASPDVTDIDDQILDLLARVEVRIGELRGQTADQIEEILNGNFERLQALLRKRALPTFTLELKGMADGLLWDETVSFETTLCRLQTGVQDEKRMLGELGLGDSSEPAPNSDEAFISQIFRKYDEARSKQDLPDAQEFYLSPKGLVRLAYLEIISVDDMKRLVAIQSMLPAPVALSEPEPINRRVRTMYSLYRAIETGIFDQELFPIFEILLRAEGGSSNLEEARAAFIAHLSPLLSKAAEGKDVCSAHDLWLVMAKLNGMIIRAHELEQDSILEHGKLSDTFFAEEVPRVTQEAKIVGKALPLLFRRLSKDSKYDVHEAQRLKEIVAGEPKAKIDAIFDSLDRHDGGRESA